MHEMILSLPRVPPSRFCSLLSDDASEHSVSGSTRAHSSSRRLFSEAAKAVEYDSQSVCIDILFVTTWSLLGA